MRTHRNTSQIKKQDKTRARDISKTDISNIPDREFKVMVIKILTGLEKRVKDMSENLNRGIRNNIAEIQRTNIIRNMHDGLHSRLKEAEGQINDLEN